MIQLIAAFCFAVFVVLALLSLLSGDAFDSLFASDDE